MHELSHALTQYTFQAPTPYASNETLYLGADPRNYSRHRREWLGESGFVIENLLFGFRLFVEWKYADSWKMDKIHQLIAQGRNNGTHVIRMSYETDSPVLYDKLGPEDATRVIDSLVGARLHMLNLHELEAAPKDTPTSFARFRPGGTTPPKACAVRKSDGFIRIEVPSGKGSTRNPQQPSATVLVGGRFPGASVSRKEDTEVPETLATNIVREPVTGGDRSVDTEEKGIVEVYAVLWKNMRRMVKHQNAVRQQL